MLAALFILSAHAAQAANPTLPGPDKILTRELADLTTGFHGQVGVYVRRLTDNTWAAIAPDDTFPTASLIKVPILAVLFDRIDHGALDYNEPLKYGPAHHHPGDDLLGSFKDGEAITPAKLVMLMATMSDNTAAVWCEELAGGGALINEWLLAHGFSKTRVNRRTPGREEPRKIFGWGQTSPREMAELLVMIGQGRLVSPAASSEMLRVLSRAYWDQESLSQIPPTVHAASKQGALEHSRSEVLLVNAPSGDYVVSVITKDQADTSWGHDNEGYVLLRKISRAAWRHFEGTPWEQASGSEKYWKGD